MKNKRIKFSKTSINLPVELRDRVKVAAAQRKVQMQDVIADLLRLWLKTPGIIALEHEIADDLEYEFEMDTFMAAGIARWIKKNLYIPVPKSEQANPSKGVLTSVDIGGDTAPPFEIPRELQEWVRRLLFILQENQPEAISAIKTNLIAFEKLTHLGGQHVPPPSDPDARTTEEIATELHTATTEKTAEELKRRNRPRRKAS